MTSVADKMKKSTGIVDISLSGEDERILDRLFNKRAKTIKLASSAAKAHALVQATQGELADLGRQLAEGKITEDEFVDRGEKLLADAYEEAFDIEGEDAEDDYSGEAASSQRSFLEDFALGIVLGAAFWPGGSKEGEKPPDGAVLSPEGIDSRAGLYSGQVWTSYQVGMSRVQHPQSMATWHAEDDAGTCDDCAGLDGQDWPLDEIPQWPGDGQTQCLGNCRCSITYEVAEEAA